MKAKNENKAKSELNHNDKVNLKDSVKSKYILKLIFSYLEKKRTLNIIKYNNAYKNIFGLNLKKYKEISGKIKIGKENGYNRIYNLNNMHIVFEGGYLNGKKNGFGKEYLEESFYLSDGDKPGPKLIFEGQYLNGVRNGIGREYNKEGNILFEGEYKNAKRWNGIRRQYYYDTILIFEYELIEGEIKGKVKEYYKNGQLEFEGEYLDGKKWNGFIYNKDDAQKYEIKNGNGKIIIYDKGELLFEGEYKNGIKYGKEYYIGGKLIFDGEYNNMMEEYKNIEPSSYEYEILKEQQWNGKIYIYEYYSDTTCCGYDTERWRSDEYMKDSDIEKYKNIKDLIKFEGEYSDDEKNGMGKEYNIEGNLIYEGIYLNNRRKDVQKKGPHYYEFRGSYSLLFEGELLNGKKNGKGKEYDYSGNLIFDGEYLNGNKVDPKRERFYNNKQLDLKRKDKLISKKENINEIKMEKEYNYEGKLIFEGEYLKGKRWNGIIYNNNYNFEIEIKSGIYKLKDSNNEIKFIYDSERRKSLNKKIYYCSNNISDTRYIIVDENGKGKEYEYNGKLIYEGEYLNWKRNGKGKEYDSDGKLKYEGEYLNEIKNGKGKKYKQGELIFEGEYLNGKKWNGKGKLLLFNDSLEIDAEYINGETKGYGKQYTYNKEKIKFEGEYINGERNGKGKEYKDDKLIFEGLYKDNIRNGKGKEYNSKGELIFDGEYLNSKKWNGKFKYFYEFSKGKRLKFDGEYINGIKTGKDYNYYEDIIYDGEHLYGMKNGKGKEYFYNGKIKFEGEYSNDRKWNGNMYDINGNLLMTMKNGKGNGKEYDMNGRLIYDGEYSYGEKNGKGKEYNNKRLIYEGEFFNGKRKGQGKEYYSISEIIKRKNSSFYDEYYLKKYITDSFFLSSNII